MDPEHSEWVLQLWNSPEHNAIIMAGVGRTTTNMLAATTIATDAAAVGFVATLALPAVTMAGVFAALGSGYAAARDVARDENSVAGFPLQSHA